MKIVVTGFEPFGNINTNPSELVINHLTASSEYELITQVLPTEFKLAGNLIRQLVQTHQPDVLISIGVAQGRTYLSLERVALNLMDATIPDNAGIVADGQSICPDSPNAYLSTMQLNHIRDTLQQHGFPIKISNHAGAYVCNYVYFCALDEIHSLNLNTQCTFLHIPHVINDNTPINQLALMGIVKAVESMITVLSKG